jgi:peptidoglycan/LPS O-acetylase OafA/YrhL
MEPRHTNPTAGGARRYDLDWLRVLAMLLIFLYHTTRPFDTLENWHVKNNQLTDAFAFTVIGVPWLMPLFFVLSGAASFFSLRSRTAWSFVRARFLRLAVPLVTLGWFVLGPLQVYIERVTNSGYHTSPFTGSFLQFLPHYFEGIYGQGGSFALHGLHLWFLFWLFTFSVVALPLFVYLMSDTGRRLIGALAHMVETPGAILSLALPLVLAEVLARLAIVPDNEEGGWYLVAYVILLIYGFLIAADARFDQAIQKHKWVALGLAVALLLAVLFTGIPSETAWWGAAGPIADVIFLAVDGWFWLVAILGFGRRYLNFAHPSLRYAGEAVLPFYILHQPIIVVIAYVIRTWDMSVGLKYLIVSTTALAVIMLIYEFLVRRFNVLRFFFGMKLLHGRQVAVQRAAGA